MKKLITLTLMAMFAITASAASITWKSGTIKFGSTSVGANATGYLVFLGTSNLDSISLADFVAMGSIADSPTKLSKMNAPLTDLGSSPVGNYAMYVTYSSGDYTYYSASSTIYTVTQANLNDLLNEGVDLADSNFQFGTSTVHDPTVTPLSSGTIGGGWYATPVPEPATGALALAGVALLFRRRKA